LFTGFALTIAGFLWFDFLPDFGKYENIAERKEAFLTYIYPKVEEVNKGIAEKRDRLKVLYSEYNNGENLLRSDKKWLSRLAEEYGVEPYDMDNTKAWEELFLRVNTIPASLVLAQAALESAWGTSRFAVKGNNLFGHQCYTEGCGIVPEYRSPELSHEVRTFPTVRESVEIYAQNLNTNSVYREFRSVRAQKHDAEGLGLILTHTLGKYSELGDNYGEILRSVILQNNLQKFDY